MADVVHGSDLTGRERKLLFWASFLSLAAAGFGFSFRVAMGGAYGEELSLDVHQRQMVFGASLWPIAITMIGFSLVVDRTGYKWPMYGAFVLQALSGIGTFFAGSYGALYLFALCAGLGHGIVEAVINPICAAVYPKEKTKWLAILHAAWPAGLVFGTLVIIATEGMIDGWRFHALWIVIPAIAYAIIYLPCKFPVDERVQAGVPYMEMLRQIGFLSAFLAGFMIVFEAGNQMGQLGWVGLPESWFEISIGVGAAIGVGFGLWVGSLGRPLFFLMCLLMIPLATAELGTDQLIKNLMTPVLSDSSINPAFAIVFSATIMLVFRVFAGGVLKFFSPPGLLCLSGVFSAVGLYWLAGATGAAIFIAFVIYALGQTYYWPCVLGFVSERYPQGGALTLNTVSAIGLLSVGIIGGQLLGVATDSSVHTRVEAGAPQLAKAAEEPKQFLWESGKTINPVKKDEYLAGLTDPAEKARVAQVYKAAGDDSGRDVLKYAARFPAILFLAFGLIALYFRRRGGYKPIELEHRTPS